MQKAERMTGTQDVHYNLVSVLYHTLQGAETAVQYISDAEESGDEELARFFREVQEEDRRRAERAKTLLGQRLSQGGGR
jgi:rubrerythrin